MATTKTIYVDTGATGADDGTSWTDAYPDLTTAVAAEATNIVTADEIHHYMCRASTGVADAAGSTAITFAGYTMGASNYVIVEGDQTSGVWDTSKYRLVRASGVNSDVFRLNGAIETCIRFKKLQVQNLRDAFFIGAFEFILGSNTPTLFDVVVDRCIVRGPGATAGALTFAFDIRNVGNATTGSVVITNNLMYEWGRGVYEQTNTGIETFLFANNTVPPMTSDNISNYTNDSAMVWKNNVVKKVLGMADFGYAYGTFDYNATSNTTCRGANGIDIDAYTVDEVWTDSSSGDYTLPSDSPLVGAGTDLSSDDITEDIIGTARPYGTNYDIGAFEYFDPVDALTADDVTLTTPTVEAATLTEIAAGVSALTASDVTVPVLRFSGRRRVAQIHALTSVSVLIARPSVDTATCTDIGLRALVSVSASSAQTGSPALGEPVVSTVGALSVSAASMLTGVVDLGTPVAAVTSDNSVAADTMSTGAPTIDDATASIAVDVDVTADTVSTGAPDVADATAAATALLSVAAASVQTGWPEVYAPVGEFFEAISVSCPDMSTGVARLGEPLVGTDTISAATLQTGTVKVGAAWFDTSVAAVLKTVPYQPLMSSARLQAIAPAATLLSVPGGPPRSRRDQNGVSQVANVTWRLVGDEYTTFMEFFAENKHSRIIAPLWSESGSFDDHICRYVYGTLTISNSGELYEVSAALEVIRKVT